MIRDLGKDCNGGLIRLMMLAYSNTLWIFNVAMKNHNVSIKNHQTWLVNMYGKWFRYRW